MIYLNDDVKYVRYDDTVKLAVESGVEPQRAYLFLASLGVKGSMARVLTSDGNDYLPPMKIAIKDGSRVLSMSVCEHCQGLMIDS